jgi:hypothetical protein
VRRAPAVLDQGLVFRACRRVKKPSPSSLAECEGQALRKVKLT